MQAENVFWCAQMYFIGVVWSCYKYLVHYVRIENFTFRRYNVDGLNGLEDSEVQLIVFLVVWYITLHCLLTAFHSTTLSHSLSRCLLRGNSNSTLSVGWSIVF